MKKIFSVFLLLGILLSNLSLYADESLPLPEEISQNFKNCQNENERYTVFNKLGSMVDSIVSSSDIKSYIRTISDLVVYAKDLGDADWVASKGTDLVQKISETKISSLINKIGAIPFLTSDQESFLYFFRYVGEAFQHNYLGKSAVQNLYVLQDRSLFNSAYLFFKQIENANLIMPINYIIEDLQTLLAATAYLYSQDYLALNEENLTLWLPRLSSNGMLRLLSDINNQILISQENDLKAVAKIMFVSKSLYSLIYAKFKNDPFNDWQYKEALKTTIAAVKKYQQMDWVINLKDVQFLIDNLLPTDFVGFCNELGAEILQRKLISRSLAQQLLHSYDLLNDIIKIKKYIYNSVTFNGAYLFIKESILPHQEIEGTYEITDKKFSQLIIAFKNERFFVAGLHSRDNYVNLAFDYFDFEESDGYYIGRTVLGPMQFVLRFKIGANKKIIGCLNSDCFSGSKVYNFPDYLSHLGNGRNVQLGGLYKGNIVYDNGSKEYGEILISSVGGYLVGNFKYSKIDNVAFDMGIHDNTNGVLYLATRVSRVPAIHILRGILKNRNELSGVWFSTSKSIIGTFHFIKVQEDLLEIY